MVSLLYDSATDQRTVSVQNFKSYSMSTYREHVRIFLPICQHEKKILTTALLPRKLNGRISPSYHFAITHGEELGEWSKTCCYCEGRVTMAAPGSMPLCVTTSAVVDTTFVDIYVDTKNIPTCRYNIQHIDKTMEK